MNNEEKKYIKLTPFKMQVIQSFPFIDADFDALTNYELLCKVVDYLNKTIDNVDVLNDEVEEYINKFNELKAYVDNYFDNLDVQEEINNKLDEMSESGELTNLIKDYVDPIYQAYEEEINEDIANFKEEINDDIDEQNTEISNFKTLINGQVQHIDEKVTNATSGSPKGVYATVSALQTADPDHDYIYVVSADGNWYYYDSTLGNWTSGGVYQSTQIDPDDANLINMFRGYTYVTDNKLDSNTNDLNNILNLRCYLYYVSNEVDNTPNLKTTSIYKCFIVNGYGYTYNNGNKVQLLYDLVSNKLYCRSKFGNANFTEWKEMYTEDNRCINFKEYVYLDTMTENNVNLNNNQPYKIYSYYLKGNQFINAPVPNNNTSYFLNVINFGYPTFYSQLAIESIPTNKIYYRSNNAGTWTEWVEIGKNYDNEIAQITSDYEKIIDNEVYDYLTSIIQEPLNLSNKSFTFCGDSITAGNFIGSTNVWAKWLSDKYNTSYNNKAVGGSTFGTHEGYGVIGDQIETGTNNPILFIAGGINDYVLKTSKADFTSALEDICSWLSTNYTGKVIFVTPINHKHIGYDNTVPLNWYRQEITRIALLNGHSVIDGTELGFPDTNNEFATLVFYDDVHPSVDGQKMYANKVYQILN